MGRFFSIVSTNFKSNVMKRPRFSEQTIFQVAKTTLANAGANLTALSEFGINAEYLSAFEADIQAAETLPGMARRRRCSLRDRICWRNYVQPMQPRS